jgi:hypothetical protein
MKSGLRTEGGWNWPRSMHNCGSLFSGIEFSGVAIIFSKGTVLASVLPLRKVPY